MTLLKGKTALVSGATAGIGKETALGLARLGAKVVIVGRNAAKTKAVVDELQAASGNPWVEHLLADLSLMAEVRRLAAEVLDRYPALHVLVNNVGAINLRRELTSEGLERTFAMNHLGPFLLTHLLRPALGRGAPSRVVNVSSDAHKGMRLDLDDLQAQKGYSSFKIYGRSKLMNILFTRELSRRLAGTGVTANALHPGMVASDFMAKPGVMGAVGGAFMSAFGISVQEGARTSVFLASSPDVEGVTGKYFVKSQARAPSRQAQDDEVAARLWAASERLAGLA